MASEEVEFQVGDQVRLRPGSKFYYENSDSPANPIRMNGKILKIRSKWDPWPIQVLWDNGLINSYETCDLQPDDSVEHMFPEI